MARPVDADALLDTLKFLANRSYNRKLTTSYSNAYKECMEFVKHAPTIEPTLQHVESVEIKHGHWIDINEDGSLWECSICGDRSCCCGNYCMECGARMDEDEWQEPEEPNINPCRGCDDYDGQGGCKSNGGCGIWITMDEVEDGKID